MSLKFLSNNIDVVQNVSCHSIFALSLTRFAFRNPNGITYCYATFDLLLQNSSITKQKSIGSFIVTLMNSPITKRCFVILNECEESLISRYF